MNFDAERSDATSTPDATMIGCSANEVAGTFASDFTTMPAWGAIYETSPARMDVFEGTLRGRPGTAPGSSVYAGLEATPEDYRARRAFVQLPTMLATSGCAQAALVVQDDDTVGDFIEISQSCGQLEALSFIGDSPTVLATAPYSAQDHRWWQIRSDGTMTYLETSPDGATWTALGETPTPSYFADAYLELSAGTYQLESLTGEVRFDDLFDCLLLL